MNDFVTSTIRFTGGISSNATTSVACVSETEVPVDEVTSEGWLGVDDGTEGVTDDHPDPPEALPADDHDDPPAGGLEGAAMANTENLPVENSHTQDTTGQSARNSNVACRFDERNTFSVFPSYEVPTLSRTVAVIPESVRDVVSEPIS